ncbi:MAG: DUF3570 domain-containing protein [Planctomycetes bacterium]|nr:DUF3570 domain-containing protein [Planctomycetota bacterium]
MIASGELVGISARVLLLVVCAACCIQLRAQEHDNTVSFDIFLFNQEDVDHGEGIGGGNPVFSEEFVYGGARFAAKLKVSDVISLRPTFGVSSIDPGPAVDAPDTISNATWNLTNATTTSASATNFTISGIMDIRPKESDWTFSPGAYFAYQPTYVSRGLDFAASVELFKGNFTPTFSYNVRWDALTGGNLRAAGIWGGETGEIDEFGFDRSVHERTTHNFELGFTQILSPDWRLQATFQYTRQDGFLGGANEQVTLFSGDTPVLFSDEKLPSRRNRLQLNLRVRFSPAEHFSLGMDHSAYWDDWGVRSVAIQPNAEGTFGDSRARWRIWSRISYQQGTRYHRGHPQHVSRYQTDDPDLWTFNAKSGGLLLWFDMPETGDMQWILRISVNGVYRSDRIWGVGALIGSEFGW